jgi:hypothetical protein
VELPPAFKASLQVVSQVNDPHPASPWQGEVIAPPWGEGEDEGGNRANDFTFQAARRTPLNAHNLNCRAASRFAMRPEMLRNL